MAANFPGGLGSGLRGTPAAAGTVVPGGQRRRARWPSGPTCTSAVLDPRCKPIGLLTPTHDTPADTRHTTGSGHILHTCQPRAQSYPFPSWLGAWGQVAW